MVRGVLGNIHLEKFLKSFPIEIREECVYTDIPIIPTKEF